MSAPQTIGLLPVDAEAEVPASAEPDAVAPPSDIVEQAPSDSAATAVSVTRLSLGVKVIAYLSEIIEWVSRAGPRDGDTNSPSN